jgi:hypothetical protein
MKTVLGYVLGFLLAGGILLVIGSIVAFALGPEKVSELYARSKPILPYFLAGLGLTVLCIVVLNVLWPDLGKSLTATKAGMDTMPSGGPVAEIRCGKCSAVNDGLAKFCDQCGGAL